MSARHCAFALTMMLGASLAGSASASDGEPDTANAHPAVGFYHVAYTRADASVETLGGCSGTLIAGDVFLTAGHCTFYDSRLLHEDPSYVAAEAWVTLDPVALDNDFRCFLRDIAHPGAGDLPCDEAARHHPDFHRASVGAITHPAYPRLTTLGDGTIAVGEPLGPGNTDLGVVLLAEPLVTTAPLPTAPLGYLERLDRTGVTLFAVGYGLAYHKSTPAAPDEPATDGPTNFVGPYGVRRVAEVGSIRNVTATRITPTQRNALGEDSVCYWDSGSPLFLMRDGVLERQVIGVLTGGGLWCMGASDPYQRIDIGPAHDFLACIGAATTPAEACRCGAEGPLGQCPEE